MLYYLLFELCPCLTVFLLGALIIYLGSIMVAYGFNSLEEANQENSMQQQMIWRKKSRLREDEYYINRGY